MAQFARPDGNITQTNFTNGFANIDEVTASDADFAYGANNTVAVLEVSLGNVTDPASSSGHTFRYRVAKTNAGVVDGGGNAVTVTAELYQGTTLIAADTAKTVTGTWTQYALTLTGGQADSITDYNDLRLRFTTSASGGSPASRRGGAVSWAELEVPDAPSGISATLTVADAAASAQDTTAHITANAALALAEAAASAQDATGALGGIAASVTPADALAAVWDVDALASGIFAPVTPADSAASAQDLIAQLEGVGADMAVGSFQVTSADSSGKTISGLQWSSGATGRTPQLLFLFTSSLGSSGETNSHIQSCTGITDGTRHWCQSRAIRDGITTTTQATRMQRQDRLIHVLQYDNAVQASFSFNAFGSDQFSLTTQVTPSGMQHNVRYVAFTGLDNVYVDVFSFTAGTGTQSLANAGFLADAIFWGSSANAQFDTAATSGIEGWGWSTKEGDQFSVGSRYVVDLSADYTTSVVATDRVLHFANLTGSILLNVEVTSHDTNGVTFEKHVAMGNIDAVAVHIKGGVWKAGTFAAHSAAEQFDVSTPGCNPVGFMLMASNIHTASRTSPFEGGNTCIGAASAEDQWATQHHSYDVGTISGPDGTEEYTIMPTDRSWVHYTRSALDTLAKAGDIARVSLGTGKFTLEQLDGDPTAVLIGYLAFGNPTSSTPAPLTVADAAASALGVTAVMGGVTATLAIASAAGEALDIDATAGLTAALASALAAAEAVDLSVVLGGITATLTLAEASALAQDVTVTLSGISASLTIAEATAIAHDVAAALGGTVASLTVAEAAGQVLTVTVTLGGITASLTSADAAAGALDLLAFVGGSFAPLTVAEATAEAVSLSVTLGAVSATLTPAEALAEAQGVAASLGGILATLLLAEAAASAQDVTVLAGGITATLVAALAAGAALGVTVSMGSVTATVTIASAGASAQDVSTTQGGVALLTPASASAVALDLLAALSGITAQLTVAQADALAQALTAAMGSVAAQLTVADAAAVTLDVLAVLGGTVAIVTVADAAADAVDVGAMLSLDLAQLTVADAVASALTLHTFILGGDIFATYTLNPHASRLRFTILDAHRLHLALTDEHARLRFRPKDHDDTV